MAGDVFAQEAKVPQGKAEVTTPAPEAPNLPEEALALKPLSADKAPMRVVCEFDSPGLYFCHMVEDANVSCTFQQACRTKLLRTLKRGEACPGYFVCSQLK